MSATLAKPPIPPPPKVPPPPARSGNGLSSANLSSVSESDGLLSLPEKVVIYGPGGVGKTELVANLQQMGKTVKIIDLDEGSHKHHVKRVRGISDWATLRTYIQDDSKWEDVDVLCIDSVTKAEELAVAHTIQTVPHEKGHKVTSVEGYGFGKGFQHVYDTFLPLLADLDRHVRAGRSVVLICHECVANVPNPSGEDFIRYEPRLQSPSSGKASIRHRLKEWCDHLLFVGYDVAVNSDGKGTGAGTRTIYPVELPTHWAKSRTLADPIVYRKGSFDVWTQLFGD